MRWSLANRLAKPSASIRSPAAIRSGQETAWPQTWNADPDRRVRAGPGPEQPVPATGDEAGTLIGRTARRHALGHALTLGPPGRRRSFRFFAPEPAASTEQERADPEDGQRAERG